MHRKRHQTATIRVGEYRYTKKGVSRFDLGDPYHLAVTLSWPQFLLLLLGVYLIVNTVFALLYVAVPGAVTNARPGNFSDVFFFSFETLATVGYGEMFPGSLYGHIVAASEIVCGLAFTAILTGLTFVRFSRPRAKFLFATNLVVTGHNGQPTLMVRVANGRADVMANAVAKLNVLVSERSPEGVLFRRAEELRLLRSSIPMFPLTWTLMHVLDEDSPLHGFDPGQMVDADARIFLSLEARDPTLAATVHAIRNYTPQDVLFGMRYADIISSDEEGGPTADITRLSELQPEDGDAPRTPGWTSEQLVQEE